MRKQRKPEKAPFAIRLTKDQANRVRAAAERDMRTVANFIEWAVAQAVANVKVRD